MGVVCRLLLESFLLPRVTLPVSSTDKVLPRGPIIPPPGAAGRRANVRPLVISL